MRIYTDASTNAKDGISGIAYVATDSRDKELYKKGAVIAQHDNNTAELCAVLYALEDIKDLGVKHVTILTDSWYAVNAVRNGGGRENEKGIVQRIRYYMAHINSDLMWIKGHYRDGSWVSFFNSRADKLSKVVRCQYEKQLAIQKGLLVQGLKNFKKKGR